MHRITETTVHVTYHQLSYADLETTRNLIGRPIPGWQATHLHDSGSVCDHSGNPTNSKWESRFRKAEAPPTTGIGSSQNQCSSTEKFPEFRV